MTDFTKTLVELNIAWMILFLAYKLFFERDKNFLVRRLYLLGVILFPLVLLLLPEARGLLNRRRLTIYRSAADMAALGRQPALQSPEEKRFCASAPSARARVVLT